MSTLFDRSKEIRERILVSIPKLKKGLRWG